ncbi:ribosome maturation factor RimP [Novispirillum itersonii]|uniref:ribosome maturation factor RimP n=1 Tax=Novispirillum itersonii TaxID=189 RepID=UPI0003615500|nr:ribosome maturation factor RimP [Novispirillum itersonii]
MDLTERLAAIVEPTISDMGYDLVRVLIQGAKHLTVQIMADRKDGALMTVDDCADISRAVSALLDVEDPISGAYNLEVSSPGIDRPLTRAKDYVTWAGFDVKVETKVLLDGRKRFSGKLMGLDEAGTAVQVHGEDGQWSIPLDAVWKAKLVLTDALIDHVTRSLPDA